MFILLQNFAATFIKKISRKKRFRNFFLKKIVQKLYIFDCSKNKILPKIIWHICATISFLTLKFSDWTKIWNFDENLQSLQSHNNLDVFGQNIKHPKNPPNDPRFEP